MYIYILRPITVYSDLHLYIHSLYFIYSDLYIYLRLSIYLDLHHIFILKIYVNYINNVNNIWCKYKKVNLFFYYLF